MNDWTECTTCDGTGILTQDDDWWENTCHDCMGLGGWQSEIESDIDGKGTEPHPKTGARR